ncbi:ANKRD50 [Symbiodinium microadriaticum]|nr:ANKRD50 [Symbiodinium microadriaticum]
MAQFLHSQQGMTAYRTEWRVYADDEDIAGSIYYVAERADGSKVIVDWKRTRRARLRDEAFGKYMRGPQCKVPDCTLWHYRLQLNVYRFILEKYYGQFVSSMYIVGTNPDNGDEPYVDDVPRMDVEVEALLRR